MIDGSYPMVSMARVISRFQCNRTGPIRNNYDVFEIGKVITVPLMGRTPYRAQRTILAYAKKHKWKVKTEIKDGMLYVLREE